jgi:single-strand DNA-binding protein
MLNTTIILGRLVRDPELRFGSSGAPVGSFSVAVNHLHQDKNNQWQDECAFIPCTAFGKSAEQLAAHHKGDPVLVAGRLRTESWEKNGASHSRLVLIAERIQFVQFVAAAKVQTDSAKPSLSMSDEARKAVPF